MQISTGSNQPSSTTYASSPQATNREVDENLFVPQGALTDEAYTNTGGATVFVAPQTPDEAWQQYAFSTSGSMVEVSTTIPVGYQYVSTQLEAMLAEHSIEAPTETTIKFAIPEIEKTVEEDNQTIQEAVFIVDNVDDEALADRIAEVLNHSESHHFKQSYLALDKLTAIENIHQAQQRDNTIGRSVDTDIPNGTDSMATYGYQQDFSMSFDGDKWWMKISVQPVELMRIEKIAS